MSVAPDGGIERKRFVRALGGLTGVNALVALLAFVTGPLQARALGPEGRGELAAVLVVVTFAPWLLTLGLNVFVARETARASERGPLFGTVTVISLITGAVGWAVAYPVAEVVAHGRHIVEVLVLVGFSLLPLSILATVFSGALWGEGDWRRYSAVRLLSAGLVVVGFLVLAAGHRLTVATAAGVTFGAGVLSVAPLVPMLRRTRGWRFDRLLAGRALSYGSRAAVGDIASISNLRLDQVLMAGLVPARELGLYAVAVTLSSVTAILSQALTLLVLPLVAGGDRRSVRRILRVTLLAVAVASAALALVAPWVVPLLFGSAFSASIGLVQVLAVGAALLAASGVLTSALEGDGHPGDTAVAQILGFAVTLPALLIVLPAWGAMGAAVTSVGSYALVFGVLLVKARQRLGGSLRDYLIVTGTDLRAFWGYASKRIALAARALGAVMSR